MSRKSGTIIKNIRLAPAIIFGTVFIAVLFFIWAVYPVTRHKPIFSSTKIYDRTGGLLYEVSNENGASNFTKLKDIPAQLQQAVIAAEDKRFYQHHGVDILATARAIKDLISGNNNGGASTIEQQLIKNIYFQGKSRSVIQKVREMLAAFYWSSTHTKQETLESYLNVIFLGNRSYGVSQAAKTYFHKDLNDLNLSEMTVLAGIIPAPSQYEPYRHWKNAKFRQQYVLQQLLASQKISEADIQNVKESNIDIFPPSYEIKAPHFVFQVLEELEKTYPDIQSGGYSITTTLDPELQSISQQIMAHRLTQLAKQNVGNSSLAAIDPQSGDVLAYIGSVNYFNKEISGAVDMVQVKRQPGSSLKPFLYLTSFMHGFTPATVIADLPVRFQNDDGTGYYPKNYGYRYFGPVTVRDALGSSLNIPAVKVLNQIGLLPFFSTLERFGIKFDQPPAHYGLSVVLGGGEVSLIDNVRAYAGLALGGRSIELRDVLEIKNAQDEVIFKSKTSAHQDLFINDKSAKPAAELITDILSDKNARSRSFGEASLLDLQKDVAVKTGTTKDFKDNWALGYTPNFVLGVWVGNTDNSPMQGVSGVSGAVPIWHDIMQDRFKNQKIDWPDSGDLIQKSICLPSGLLATPDCPKNRVEKFITGTEPTTLDTWYQPITIDKNTGLLANDSCSQNVISKTYLFPPQEYQSWVLADRREAPPVKYCDGTSKELPGEGLSIIYPLDNDVFELSDLFNSQTQMIPFTAGGQANMYRWKINGQLIESRTNPTFWKPSSGTYNLSLEGLDSSINFTVK